jgi:cation-transporting P-type ATPase E
LLIDWLVIGVPAFLLALEPNTRLVTGSFLKNVMKSALPAALVVVINSLVIFALAPALNMGYIEISTLVVISATVTSLTLLYRVSVPFNVMRIILFTLMVTLFILAVTFIPFFFKFAPFYPQSYNAYDPLTLPQMLLMLVLAQATPPLMFVLSNVFKWIKTAVRAILNRLADL